MEYKIQKDKLNLFNDLRSYSRHWVKEFIEAYKNEICLWQTKHPDYNNHILRNQAYDKLVEKLKEVESNPDRSMVVRKINSLRSAFRREFRKKCVRPDYEPRLWYYNALAFIADQQFATSIKRESTSSIKDHHGSRSSHEKEKKRLFSENFDEDESNQQENEDITMEQYEEAVTDDIKEEHTTRMIEVSSNGEQQQLITIEHQDNKMIEIHTQRDKESHMVTFQNAQREQETQQVTDAVNSITTQQQPVPVHTIHIQAARDSYETGHNDKDHQLKVMNLYKPDCFPVFNTSMTKHDDEYDAIGINVASKLRSMNHHQRIVAEKLISDVLFSGQLDSLTVQSKLVV